MSCINAIDIQTYSCIFNTVDSSQRYNFLCYNPQLFEISTHTIFP